MLLVNDVGVLQRSVVGSLRSVVTTGVGNIDDFDSLRIGSFRLSRLWAVRRRRKASCDNFTGSGFR